MYARNQIRVFANETRAAALREKTTCPRCGEPVSRHYTLNLKPMLVNGHDVEPVRRERQADGRTVLVLDRSLCHYETCKKRRRKKGERPRPRTLDDYIERNFAP